MKLLKMMPLLAMAGLIALMPGCVGNLTPMAYVDPGFEKMELSKLKPVPDAQKINVCVSAEFRRKGSPLDAVTVNLRNQITAVLMETGVFATVSINDQQGGAKLRVVMDNIEGSTKGSGYLTGATLGAVGTQCTDPYHLTITLDLPGNKSITKEYNHAIHSTIGAKSISPNLTPMTINEAFNQVVKEVVLVFLRDMQAEGRL